MTKKNIRKASKSTPTKTSSTTTKVSSTPTPTNITSKKASKVVNKGKMDTLDDGSSTSSEDNEIISTKSTSTKKTSNSPLNDKNEHSNNEKIKRIRRKNVTRQLQLLCLERYVAYISKNKEMPNQSTTEMLLKNGYKDFLKNGGNEKDTPMDYNGFQKLIKSHREDFPTLEFLTETERKKLTTIKRKKMEYNEKIINQMDLLNKFKGSLGGGKGESTTTNKRKINETKISISKGKQNIKVEEDKEQSNSVSKPKSSPRKKLKIQEEKVDKNAKSKSRPRGRPPSSQSERNILPAAKSTASTGSSNEKSKPRGRPPSQSKRNLIPAAISNLSSILPKPSISSSTKKTKSNEDIIETKNVSIQKPIVSNDVQSSDWKELVHLQQESLEIQKQILNSIQTLVALERHKQFENSIRSKSTDSNKKGDKKKK